MDILINKAIYGEDGFIPESFKNKNIENDKYL